jgi:glycosyltransferase involved in cell wall biosynthesis
MQKNKILFLIRAYNEGTRIVSVIESIFEAGFESILLVDDGSLDGTAHDVEARFPGQITLIRHSINRGAGAALETGFTYIRNSPHKSDWDYVVTFDADGQHDVADISAFMEAFEDHKKTQVVYGSRFITKTRSNVPFFRRILLW